MSAFYICGTEKIVYIPQKIVYVLNFSLKKKLDLQYFWGINSFSCINA